MPKAAYVDKRLASNDGNTMRASRGPISRPFPLLTDTGLDVEICDGFLFASPPRNTHRILSWLVLRSDGTGTRPLISGQLFDHHPSITLTLLEAES